MTVEIADDNKLFFASDIADEFGPEDGVADYIENHIDGDEGIKVIECNGSEL
jgi:hypothetical protein